MDAFRLLSRPSTTSRSKSAKPKVLPSNSGAQAAEASPQAVFKAQLSNQKTSQSSKKRKRGVAQPAPDLPQELDFFAAAKAHEGPAGSSKGTEEVEAADVLTSEVDDGVDLNRQRMPEEERRRILKQHKIKITRLDSAAQTIQPSEHKSKKRKQREEEARKEDKKHKKHHMDVIPEPVMDFEQLRSGYGIDRRLAANIRAHGYRKATEVQLAALPLLLGSQTSEVRDDRGAGNGYTHKSAGVDLLTVAPTGSGKTLAFLIPVIQSLLRNEDASRSGPRAVIVAPTKELANQTVHEAEKLIKDTGLHVALARKGMSLGNARRNRKSAADAAHTDSDSHSDGEDEVDVPARMKAASDIIVTTPLTLVKAIESHGDEGNALSRVKHLVLDEADVLLDPLFRRQTLQIWSACSHPDLRISLWSATMGASVEDLALSTIRSRLKTHSPPTSSATQNTPVPLLRLIIGLKDSAIPHIAHHLIYCGTEAGKLLSLRQLLRPTSNSTSSTTTPPLRPPFLIFTQTIPRARALHSELLYDIPASAGGSTRIAVLHADLTSKARAEIMARVRKGEVWVLITTDLLSRGVDFQGLNGVVNYDFPSSSAVYVHRVGRTGRAGREGGVAVTLYDKEDVPFVKNVANVIAAARRARGTAGGENDEGQVVRESGLEKWLLESLPKPTKRDRQRLKRRGIESRRPDLVDAKKASKMRITTKSGFERRTENRRKGAVEGSRRRAKAGGGDGVGEQSDDGGFEGFD